MTKEKLDELWDEVEGPRPEHISNEDISGRNALRTHILMFARALLLECAKTVCINCKDGNLSEVTADPSRRVHKLTANYHESCRSPSLFIEGE